MTEEHAVDHDLRSRVVALEHKIAEHETKLIGIDAWQRQADIFNARGDERLKRIESDLQKINGTLAKIMWIIIGGIGSGFVAFLLSGGFKIP